MPRGPIALPFWRVLFTSDDPGLEKRIPPDLGCAGFKLTYPLQTEKEHNQFLLDSRSVTGAHAFTITPGPATSVRGFGLLQRDRDFRDYLDTEAQYHRRPSASVR